MSRNYKIRDQRELYFVSFATVNWIDVFTRVVYKEIVVDSLNYCIANKGVVTVCMVYHEQSCAFDHGNIRCKDGRHFEGFKKAYFEGYTEGYC